MTSTRNNVFLQVGDQVLVLLPSTTNKLHPAWQGPYQVTRIVSDVDYEVYRPEEKSKEMERLPH